MDFIIKNLCKLVFFLISLKNKKEIEERVSL